MHLDQHIKTHLGCAVVKVFEVRHLQAGDDEQNGIRPQRSRLNDLIRVKGEVFSQYREAAGRSGRLKVVIGALKKVDVGQHREACSAALLIAACDICGMEIRANDAFTGACAFDLGNHRRLVPSYPIRQRLSKSAYRVSALCRQRQLTDGTSLLPLRHFFRLAVKNRFQHGGRRELGAHIDDPRSGCAESVCVKETNSASFSAAAPEPKASSARAIPSARLSAPPDT